MGKHEESKARIGGRLLQRIDDAAEGRRIKCLAGIGLVQSILAPMWDRLLGLGLVAEKLAVFSFVGTILFLGTGVTLLLAKGSKMLESENRLWSWSIVRQIAREAWEELRWRKVARSSWPDFVARMAIGTAIVILGLRSVIALVRWCLWKSVIQVGSLPLIDRATPGPKHLLEGLFRFEERTAILATLSLTGAVLWLMGGYVRRRDSGPSEKRARAYSAVFAENPLVARLHPEQNSRLAELESEIVGSRLMSILQHLATWEKPKSAARNENELKESLTNHLQAKFSLPPVQHRIGDELKAVFDINVDGEVIIEVKHQLEDRLGEGDRAIGQIVRYAELWNNSLPVLLYPIGTKSSDEVVGRLTNVVRKWNMVRAGTEAPIAVLVDTE